MRRFVQLVAMLAVSGLILAACGGDDDALSEEEFLEQGNAICAAGNERLEEAGAGFSGEQPSPEELEAFLEILIDDVRGQLDDIEALSPPEELEEDVDELIESARGTIAEVEDAGPDALLSPEDPFAEENAMADEIGLTECADNS